MDPALNYLVKPSFVKAKNLFLLEVMEDGRNDGPHPPLTKPCLPIAFRSGSGTFGPLPRFSG